MGIFFSRLLDVKPQNKYDYYTLSKWMVSKRLAFALVIGLGLWSASFILAMQPVYSWAGKNVQGTIRTYHYDSIPLKFKTGVVQILAKDKHLAYVGNVEQGYCTGAGKLYDKQNALVYEGQFAHSRFHGQGKLYYPTGQLCYEGMFVNNEFSGTGISYTELGVMQYAGNFLQGERSGQGKLYNSAGSLLLTGNFALGSFLFPELLGKTAQEVSQIYTGQTGVYIGDKEYCVLMKEIGAVYALADAANTLEGEGIITQVVVDASEIGLGGKKIVDINGLTAYFGQPVYYGQTYVTLSEGVLQNSRQQDSANTIGMVSMDFMQTFDNVFTVQGYDQNFELYIYVYQIDNLLYTFYCENGGSPGFQYYSVSLQ